MAKAKSIDGKDLMISLGGKTIALATSCTINITRAMNSASSKDDGAWDNPVPGDMTWDCSSDSNFSADASDTNNQEAFDSLFAAQVAGTALDVVFGVVSNPSSSGVPDGGWTLKGMYSGKAYVSELSATGAKNSPATFSVKLNGSGELKPVIL